MNENGLQVILLTFCILWLAAWGLVGPQVNAQREAELISGLHLHQLLHNTTASNLYTNNAQDASKTEVHSCQDPQQYKHR